MKSLENSFALVIGIANYPYVRKLPEIVLNDARDIASILKDQNYCGYPPNNVKLLLDDEATQSEIMYELGVLSEKCDEESTVCIYVSSHGAQINQGDHAGEYLLPFDAAASNNERLANSGISSSDFTEALRAIRARKLIVMFDCCHAGGIGQPKDSNSIEVKSGISDSYYESLGKGRGRVVLASSRSEEVSWILPRAKNSLFTQHLVDGLKGGALGSGGVIRIFDLFEYVQPRVTSDHADQHPIFKAELEENFAIALYQGGKSTPIISSSTTIFDNFEYDVFVSYRHKDKVWVRKMLVPALEKQGIRVFIDFRDFRLGAPLVTEMARGVELSRYTLAVLTPMYLQSNFTELESILAEHVSLERSERRLLAVMREDCIPRLGIRARPWLDMTDDEEFQNNVIRLAHELKLAPSK